MNNKELIESYLLRSNHEVIKRFNNYIIFEWKSKNPICRGIIIKNSRKVYAWCRSGDKKYIKTIWKSTLYENESHIYISSWKIIGEKTFNNKNESINKILECIMINEL